MRVRFVCDLGKCQGVVYIGSENPGGQTVRCVVSSVNEFLHGGELEDALDWSEYLLPGDGHVVLDPREDSWLYEVALLPQPRTTALQLGSLRPASRNERENFIKLGLVNLRALINLLIPLGSHLPLLGQLHGAGYEPVVDAGLDKCAG